MKTQAQWMAPASVWAVVPVLLAVVVPTSTEQWDTSYGYLMGEFSRCNPDPPDVLVWVQGRAADVQMRTMIRKIYGSPTSWPDGYRVMLVFFTGIGSPDQRFQTLLRYEFEQYGDIVQNRYIEAYYNQTLKMMSAINYISDFCPNASLVLRIDDDVLFHPLLVLSNVISFMGGPNKTDTTPANLRRLPRNTIACRLISDYGVWRKKDHPKHFNAVDDTVLPGETMYPPFCAGFFIAMTGDVPGRLQGHIATNKPFWMDDRYMGVLQKRGGVTNIDISQALDFGYNTITEANINQVIGSQIVAKHLPGDFKLHMTELFEFVDLALHGLRGYFTNIKKKKK